MDKIKFKGTFLYPHHKMWGGGYTGFALSRRSVSPYPILVRFITPLLMEGYPSNLNDTFTSTRGCAEPMLPMCQVKVKVTVKGQIFNKQYYTLCRVRSITPLLMKGFPSNLNDTFTATRGCAEPMLPMCQVKVKVTVKGQIFNKQYYTLCRVRSITSIPMEGFSSNLNDTFSSTRGCAEPMLPMYQLKVKVTVKCHVLNKQILDFMSCRLYKPYSNVWISLNLQSPCCLCVTSRSRSQLKAKY